MAARLYPKLDTEERVLRARELLSSLDGTFSQRWRWVIAVPE
jgi:cyclopropane-fatty-acyl-phospholipid synthase